MRSSGYLLLGLLWLLATPLAAESFFNRESRTRGLLFGWGHSSSLGWPGFGNTESNVAFFAFHPQAGWFVTDRLELYGEGTLLLYHQPELRISGGLLGLAGRYHFWSRPSWSPYVTLGSGLIWTSLEVPEIDRSFNFQVIWGGGIRFRPERGPGWIVEYRNHHISNAGTAGPNLGINAATLLIGLDWVIGGG